jgi:hypothetical protein
MIWAACLVATLLGAVAAHIAKDRRAFVSCLIVAGGLVLTRAFLFGLPADWTFTAYGALWVSIGGMIARFYAGAGLLLIASGLCYFWAWVEAIPIAPGQVPLIMADFLGFAALAWICGGAIRGLVGAIDGMGLNRPGRGFNRGLSGLAREKEGQA